MSKKLTRWFNERSKECLEGPNHLQYIQFFPSLSYVFMFVCLSEPVPALLGANDKRGCYKKGPPLKPRHSLSHCICLCLCKWKKKKACIIFLWALRFILFCCQSFGNAFYKLYWDKISRDVCICLSSAQYYFLMHFWLCQASLCPETKEDNKKKIMTFGSAKIQLLTLKCWDLEWLCAFFYEHIVGHLLYLASSSDSEKYPFVPGKLALKYIDYRQLPLFYSIKGSKWIDWQNKDGMQVKEEWNPEADVSRFTGACFHLWWICVCAWCVYVIIHRNAV